MDRDPQRIPFGIGIVRQHIDFDRNVLVRRSLVGFRRRLLVHICYADRDSNRILQGHRVGGLNHEQVLVCRLMVQIRGSSYQDLPRFRINLESVIER